MIKWCLRLNLVGEYNQVIMRLQFVEEYHQVMYWTKFGGWLWSSDEWDWIWWVNMIPLYQEMEQAADLDPLQQDLQLMILMMWW